MARTYRRTTATPVGDIHLMARSEPIDGRYGVYRVDGPDADPETGTRVATMWRDDRHGGRGPWTVEIVGQEGRDFSRPTAERMGDAMDSIAMRIVRRTTPGPEPAKTTGRVYRTETAGLVGGPTIHLAATRHPDTPGRYIIHRVASATHAPETGIRVGLAERDTNSGLGWVTTRHDRFPDRYRPVSWWDTLGDAMDNLANGIARNDTRGRMAVTVERVAVRYTDGERAGMIAGTIRPRAMAPGYTATLESSGAPILGDGDPANPNQPAVFRSMEAAADAIATAVGRWR